MLPIVFSLKKISAVHEKREFPVFLRSLLAAIEYTINDKECIKNIKD